MSNDDRHETGSINLSVKLNTDLDDHSSLNSPLLTGYEVVSPLQHSRHSLEPENSLNHGNLLPLTRHS